MYVRVNIYRCVYLKNFLCVSHYARLQHGESVLMKPRWRIRVAWGIVDEDQNDLHGKMMIVMDNMVFVAVRIATTMVRIYILNIIQ